MGRSRGRTTRSAVVLAVLVAMGALAAPGCVPGANRATSATGSDRAAVAKRAARALAAAQARTQGCEHVVMSEDRRLTPAPEYPVFLTDAVATAEPCWDKIVFTFQPTGSDTPPGYEAEYRKPPFTEGPNQNPVETLGTAFLSLTFNPASSIDATNPNKPILMYRGNLRLRLEDMHHTEIVRKLIDGDGTVGWIIGLDEKRPFTIDAANNPPRVIVYVAR